MRKPPIRHPVKGHYRRGKWIDSFERGKGQRSQRSSRVVSGISYPTMVDPDGKYPIKMIGHNFRDSQHNRFFKKHGIEFTRAKHGTNRILTSDGMFCFENSRKLYLKMKKDKQFVQYYEGYAATESGITVPHAWLVHNGEVIDDTWGDEGFRYIGVPIKHRYLRHPLKRFVLADKSPNVAVERNGGLR